MRTIGAKGSIECRGQSDFSMECRRRRSDEGRNRNAPLRNTIVETWSLIVA